MTSIFIAYIVGHVTGAVCDRNRHSIMSFASDKAKSAYASLKERFK